MPNVITFGGFRNYQKFTKKIKIEKKGLDKNISMRYNSYTIKLKEIAK